MKTVYLHIGFHKTGTSALQEALDENREKLADNDYFYPASLLGFPAQQEMSWSVIEDKRKWMEISYNKEEVYSHHLASFAKSNLSNLIISSEDFTFLDHKESSVQEVFDFFKGFNVKVVCYVREPIDFLISLYNHRLRVGETTLPFERYLVERLNPNVAMFNYRLKNWENIFGVNNLIVRNFKASKLVGNSIFTDFMDSVKAPFKLDVDQFKVSNVGVHPSLQSLYSYAYSHVENIEDRAKYLKTAAELSKALPKGDSKKAYLSEEMFNFLTKLYAPMKNEIYKKYGIIL